MLLNCLFPYFLNLRMDSLLMHLENMQPSSLVKEKGIFIVNGLNTWYPFPCNAMVSTFLICIHVPSLFILTIFVK